MSTCHGEAGGQVSSTLYVDNGRIAWDPAAPATRKADQIKARLAERFGIAFGKEDPAETHFLAPTSFVPIIGR